MSQFPNNKRLSSQAREAPARYPTWVYQPNHAVTVPSQYEQSKLAWMAWALWTCAMWTRGAPSQWDFSPRPIVRGRHQSHQRADQAHRGPGDSATRLVRAPMERGAEMRSLEVSRGEWRWSASCGTTDSLAANRVTSQVPEAAGARVWAASTSHLSLLWHRPPASILCFFSSPQENIFF